MTPRRLAELDVGIISDAIHHRDEAGRLYVIAPLARQFDQWASLVRSVTVCAPLEQGPPPATHRPYSSDTISLIPVPRAGGDTFRAKLRLLRLLPAWWVAIGQLLKKVDAVHVRCPNNISIPGLIAAHLRPVLRHSIFTGNWAGYPTEPFTYRAQRFVLQHFFRGVVAVYGPPPGTKFVPTFSPSITEADWQADSAAADAKVALLRSRNRLERVTMASVGAFDPNKNQVVALRALRRILDSGLDAELHLLGDGPLRPVLEQTARELRLDGKVVFRGLVPHAEVRRTCREVDFVVQPSFTEGFTKVPVEALSAGAIALLSDLSVNREMVGAGSEARGRTFDAADDAAIAAIVCELASHTATMSRMIANGRAYAATRTLEAWRAQLRQSLEEGWHLDGADVGPVARSEARSRDEQ